jgi:hypothetical protein
MWDERMPLAHAHKVFITFNLTIRFSGVSVRVLRYGKKYSHNSKFQERRRGQAEQI